MTALAAITNADLEAVLLDGLACNAEQARLIHDPSEDVDSAAEHAACLLRLTSGQARYHAQQIVKLLAAVQRSNGVEGDLERQAIADAAIVGTRVRRRWTIKRLAPALRPLLADAGNPMLGRVKRQRRVDRIVEIVQEAPVENLRNVWLRNELGVNKFTDLQVFVDRIHGSRS